MNILEAKRTEAEVLSALGGVHEENPVFKAVGAVIATQALHEYSAAVAPGLSDHDRHYNAGRAAAISDLNQHLRRLWQKANQPK